VGRPFLRACGLLALAASVLLMGQPLRAGSETDENLESSARGAYVFRKLLADEGISVEVSNGIVTLRGSVGLALQRELAEEAVAAMPGIRSIDNQILVKPALPGAAEALLALRVKTVLGLHAGTRPLASTLEVAGDLVILKGEAADETLRGLAADYAADIEGVAGVKNELTLSAPKPTAKPGDGTAPVAASTEAGAPLAEVDDPSVAAQVRMVLRAHRSTKGLKPGVEVRDGVLTLSGEVATAAERERAGALCADIPGVRKVVNRLTPEPESTQNP
jgi:osmotically-inducible protein OsmY